MRQELYIVRERGRERETKKRGKGEEVKKELVRRLSSLFRLYTDMPSVW